MSAILVSGPVLATDEKDEMKKLDGRWDVTALVMAGTETPADKRPKSLTIKAGVLTGFGPEMNLATDATKSPKWLNMTFKREGTESTVNAVYALDGDTLKICLPLAPAKGQGKGFENKRPEGFETKDKAEMMIALKRAKK